RAQHGMGRRVTERITATAKSGDNETLHTLLAAFNRMYRPHEAREDTVLFPALHKVVSKHEYDAMGEQFEAIERKTFGGDGFDMAVDQVTELEKQFGIYDIAQVTPSLPPANGPLSCCVLPQLRAARLLHWRASGAAAVLRR